MKNTNYIIQFEIAHNIASFMHEKEQNPSLRNKIRTKTQFIRHCHLDKQQRKNNDRNKNNSTRRKDINLTIV